MLAASLLLEVMDKEPPLPAISIWAVAAGASGYLVAREWRWGWLAWLPLVVLASLPAVGEQYDPVVGPMIRQEAGLGYVVLSHAALVVAWGAPRAWAQGAAAGQAPASGRRGRRGGVSPDRLDCGVCLLRPWRQGDRDALVRHADSRAVWRNLRDLFPHPYTPADADAWLAFAAADPPPPWTFAIDVLGEAVGTISLSPQRQDDVERHSVEVGYWLGEAFWGRGIATAALRAVTAAALREPDVYRVFAPVFAWNPASMRVLEKAGYHREASSGGAP